MFCFCFFVPLAIITLYTAGVNVCMKCEGQVGLQQFRDGMELRMCSGISRLQDGVLKLMLNYAKLETSHVQVNKACQLSAWPISSRKLTYI